MREASGTSVELGCAGETLPANSAAVSGGLLTGLPGL